MLTEKFNLLWNGYKENSLLCFKEAHSQLEFSDVTLVSDDGKQIKCHKFILSSCSPVFRKILVNNPHQHPLIYLTNVKHIELRSIIDFMYLGETEVDQDDLENFMKVAARFQIKGLALNEITRPKETIEEASKQQVDSSCVEYNNLENEVESLYTGHSNIKEEFEYSSESTSIGTFMNPKSTNLDSSENFD